MLLASQSDIRARARPTGLPTGGRAAGSFRNRGGTLGVVRPVGGDWLHGDAQIRGAGLAAPRAHHVLVMSDGGQCSTPLRLLNLGVVPRRMCTPAIRPSAPTTTHPSINATRPQGEPTQATMTAKKSIIAAFNAPPTSRAHPNHRGVFRMAAMIAGRAKPLVALRRPGGRRDVFAGGRRHSRTKKTGPMIRDRREPAPAEDPFALHVAQECAEAGHALGSPNHSRTNLTHLRSRTGSGDGCSLVSSARRS
jgi:hypothetical protein